MKVRKKIISFPADPPAQRASKTLFLMEIIWSILRSDFAKTRNAVVFCALRAGLFFGTKRNRLVICVLHAVLLEQGILCFLCTSRGAFRTRNTLFSLHSTRSFENEKYSCCLCTSRSVFRTGNTRGSSCLCTLRAGFMVKKSPKWHSWIDSTALRLVSFPWFL